MHGDDATGPGGAHVRFRDADLLPKKLLGTLLLPAPFFRQHHGVKTAVFQRLNNIRTHLPVAALLIGLAGNQFQNLIGHDGLVAAHVLPLCSESGAFAPAGK